MEKKQYAPKSNAHRGSTAGGSGRHKRKGGDGGSKPVKVVYISNPVRVTTSEAGFRSLVQELTGRHADPSKYNAAGGTADVGESSGGSPAGPLLGAALPSPGASTEESSDATAASNVPATAVTYDYDDEDSFPSQLIDNRYSVFSPPTFLYGDQPHGVE